MSREIKFRAWDKINKCCCEVKFIDFERKLAHLSVGDKWYSASFENIDLMQYTGLKDKNGVEVFDGNILKVFTIGDDPNDFKYVYVDYDPYGGFYLVERPAVRTLRADDDFDEVEVVGSIYENPELLKEK